MGERKNVVFPFKAFSFSKRKAELFFTKWERKAELFSKRKAELFFTRAFVYLLSFFQSPFRGIIFFSRKALLFSLRKDKR
jgi:hypothetical protein